MVATLKVHKCDALEMSVRLVKDLHEPYQAPSSAKSLHMGIAPITTSFPHYSWTACKFAPIHGVNNAVHEHQLQHLHGPVCSSLQLRVYIV